MANTSPTVSQIRSASAKAVGGGRKRCRKGKNCSATCIDSGKVCLVELPESAGVATSKVVRVIQSKKVSNISPASGGGEGTPQHDTAIDKIQKMADDDKLKRLERTAEEYKAKWAATIGNGKPETSKAASATYQFVKKEFEDYKKEYDDKYNRPAAVSPKQLMEMESKRVRDRIEDRINSGLNYDKETNARWRAAREEKYEPFKKLSNDQLAALELYGENKQKYFRDVNTLLRTGKLENVDPERRQIIQNIVSNLTATLDRLPASSETNFVRAVSGPAVQSLGKLKVGDVIEDKGFGSYTTRNKPTVLDQFYNTGAPNAAMRVTSRNARNVSPVMPFEREEEHILKPGTKLRVVEIIEAGGLNGERSRKVGAVPTYVFEEVE